MKSGKSYLSLVLTLLFIYGSGTVKAQENSRVDSLTQLLKSAPPDSNRVDILINLWQETAYNNTDDAIGYAFDIIRVSKQLQFEKGLATGYQRLGISYDQLGLNDSARFNCNKALSLYRKNHEKRLEGSIVFNLGLLFQSEALYDKFIGPFSM